MTYTKAFFALLLVSFVMAGCGYQLGSLKIGQRQKLAVPQFTNRTGEPNLETLTTNEVIRKLQVDGTYIIVADQTQADYVLLVDLVNFHRDALTFDRNDVTNDFRILLTANLVFKDAKTEKTVWISNRVEGEATYPRGSNQPESERAVLPILISDTAKRIVDKVADGGW